jgi:hypothetical protein
MRHRILGGLGALSVLAMSAGNAWGKEFFIYRTDCKVVVDGKLGATASYTTSFGTFTNSDSQSFAQTFPIVDPYYLTFSGGMGVYAAITDSFVQCCKTEVFAEVFGKTWYNFVGDTVTMEYTASSYREHLNKVDRGPVSICDGKPVLTDTDYFVPDTAPLTADVPFKFNAYGGSILVYGDIALKRADTGPTTGSTVGVWIVYNDVNCNCEIDLWEPQVWGDKGIVFPNDSFSNETEFKLKDGCYVARFIYWTNSHLDADSPKCFYPVKESSVVEDKLYVKLSVIP